MNDKVRGLKDTLWLLAFFGLIAGIMRLWFGLGATTNLSDAVPWGLWKILNMVAGVALSTCGFTLGFLVYVLKMEKFKPLIRPAILIAFLGYGSSCLALLFDIGLPQRFWHPFIFWNEHSFLFEVFWCVMLYFTVTFLELAPNIAERFNAKKFTHFMHKIAIGVVVVGISLSSLHHSSLGSLFLVTPQRLHELWFSPLLPLAFIISAMGCGMFFLILVKILYARWYDPQSVFGQEAFKFNNLVCTINGNKHPKAKKVYGKDMNMLSHLGIIAASILGVYLLIKIYDLIANGSWQALIAGTWESWLYGFELLMTAILPITLAAINRTRNSPYGLGAAAFSASFGLALNRMDVGIFGYFRDAGTVYFPSLAEWALSMGVVAAAGLAFLYVAEYFTIFDEQWKQRSVTRGVFQSAFDSLSRVWQNVLHSGLHRVTIIAVFALPAAFVLMYPPYDEPEKENIEPAAGHNIQRTILNIDGNRSNVKTIFPHKDHQKRLGGEESCMECHHISMPGDKSTPCFRCHRHMVNETKIFDHDAHTIKVAEDQGMGGLHPENHSCYYCHAKGQAKTPENAKQCIDCHDKDMNLVSARDTLVNFYHADSYMDAMHKTCIPCHKQRKAEVSKPWLDECSTCHKELSKEQKEKIKLTEVE